MEPVNNWVAVIGAGPAGLFAARELALQNVNVVLINRDIKPGGLAEYGIYPDKKTMKDGLRAQFRKILALPNIYYCGNLMIGRKADIHLNELQAMGFGAILVTVGAQGTKYLGLPGEDLEGVYHAKDLVYHYNHLPPFSEREFKIGKRVAVIGAGNVSLDIAHFLSSLPQVEQVLAIIRRGPAEIKFERRELEYVAKTLDLADLDVQLEQVAPLMRSLGQSPEDFRSMLQMAYERGADIPLHFRFDLRFLVSPMRILGDAFGRVCGMELEENTLVAGENGDTKARPTGKKHTLDVDTVIFAIGDQVDGLLGLPVAGNGFVKNPRPEFPVDGLSYEVCDNPPECSMEGVFVAGWSREASKGLVGVARRDGTQATLAIRQYLAHLPPDGNAPYEAFCRRITRVGKPLVTQRELAALETAEQTRAAQLGVPEFKFDSNEDMLVAIRLKS
jgi:ferredoxin/flavodoxin---NADP+ reductase